MDLKVKRKTALALLCGVLGCLCFGAGDWLMLYGDTAHKGSIFWLTEGAAAIPAWRNNLAMALSFPGILLYGIALLALGNFLRGEQRKRIYWHLTTFSLTPWLALHLFYIMILFGFEWMTGNGGTVRIGSAVWTFGVDRTGQRGADAAAVFLLGISAHQGQKSFSQMDGAFQPTGILRDFEGCYFVNA